MYDFPHRLKALRIQKKMSQTEVGSLIGANANTVGKWERGITQPNASALYLLCEMTGTDIRWLLGMTDERP